MRYLTDWIREREHLSEDDLADDLRAHAQCECERTLHVYAVGSDAERCASCPKRRAPP